MRSERDVILFEEGRQMERRRIIAALREPDNYLINAIRIRAINGVSNNDLIIAFGAFADWLEKEHANDG